MKIDANLKNTFKNVAIVIAVCCLLSCRSSPEQRDGVVNFNQSDYEIRLIGMTAFNSDMERQGLPFGGISGIDHIDENRFIIISDDRSEFGPARAYEVEISYSLAALQEVSVEEMIILKNFDGQKYQRNEIDLESIRYNPSSNTFYYTSEGGRNDRERAFIREMNREGLALSELEISSVFTSSDTTGMRDNGAFESLAFQNDSVIWYANELPLLQDGEVPGFSDGIYPIRLVHYDIRNRAELAQYAYHLEKVESKPSVPTGFYINSVPELYFGPKGDLWVLERAYVEGVGNFAKLFQVNLDSATNIQETPSISKVNYQAVSKSLILDFKDYKLPVDNIEGMCFGKALADGRKSLIFVSDNNFNEMQQTQFWLFALEENSNEKNSAPPIGTLQ